MREEDKDEDEEEEEEEEEVAMDKKETPIQRHPTPEFNGLLHGSKNSIASSNPFSSANALTPSKHAFQFPRFSPISTNSKNRTCGCTLSKLFKSFCALALFLRDAIRRYVAACGRF